MDRLWAFRFKEDSSISHHGIEGQKWGVRNGPPYPLNSKALASSVFNNANRRINKISSDVTSSVKVAGSKMYGLEHKLKTKESIQRKIETDAKEKGISERKAADSIRDAVRFTTISDIDNFVSSYERFKEQMADKGYTEVRCKNYFEQFKEGKVKHKSVQSNFATEDGYIFEVQFQTPASQNVKNRKIPLYEEARKLSTSPSRKREIELEMEKMASEIKDPKDISRIKSHG